MGMYDDMPNYKGRGCDRKRQAKEDWSGSGFYKYIYVIGDDRRGRLSYTSHP